METQCVTKEIVTLCRSRARQVASPKRLHSFGTFPPLSLNKRCPRRKRRLTTDFQSFKLTFISQKVNGCRIEAYQKKEPTLRRKEMVGSALKRYCMTSCMVRLLLHGNVEENSLS